MTHSSFWISCSHVSTTIINFFDFITLEITVCDVFWLIQSSPFCIRDMSLFWLLKHPRRGISAPTWRSPDTVLLLTMSRRKWFLNSLSETKHELFTNHSIYHSLMDSVSQLCEPLWLSKSRGAAKIKVFKTSEFGRPWLALSQFWMIQKYWSG